MLQNLDLGEPIGAVMYVVHSSGTHENQKIQINWRHFILPSLRESVLMLSLTSVSCTFQGVLPISEKANRRVTNPAFYM